MMPNFHFTENSIARNQLTERYEPLQPFLLFELGKLLGSNVFIDVGANVGIYSVLHSMLPSIKSIYSFEACRDTYYELKANIELNRLSAITHVSDKAISSRKGLLEFQIAGPNSGINSVASTSFHANHLFNSITTVEATTLDDCIKTADRIISIKIDVEGHELEVIKGASTLLSKNTCLIQIEVYKDIDEIKSMLLSSGYKQFFNIHNDYYFTNSNALREDKALIEVIRQAIELKVDSNLGKWRADVPHPLGLTVSVKDNQLHALCEASEDVFNNDDLEYAFYVLRSGKRIFTKWYSRENFIDYPIDDGSKNISVTGFAREKSNPLKKASINCTAKFEVTP